MPEWLQKAFVFVLVALGFGGSGVTLSALTQEIRLIWVFAGAVMMFVAWAMLKWAARYERSGGPS
jgi:protein-S-isoprenylcysteine O-methyltransferase Ste14